MLPRKTLSRKKYCFKYFYKTSHQLARYEDPVDFKNIIFISNSNFYLNMSKLIIKTHKILNKINFLFNNK
jgi:hypothetical protein